MPPDQAVRAAGRTIGPVLRIKEECRDARKIRLIQEFWQDLRYGARMLRKSPVFTAVAVLTLGLGVGANSAIFSVIDAVLLRPLTFREPDRLARVYTTAFNGVLTKVTSKKDFDDWQQQNDVFEQMAIYGYDGNTITGIGEPRQVDSADAGPALFELFGVSPLLGRTFAPEEYAPNGHRVLLLGEAFWKQQFGSDPNILGRSLVVDGYEATIVGVMPDRFELLVGEVQMWLPFLNAELSRGNRNYWAVGRLKPGISMKQASSEMSSIAARLEQSYHGTNFGWGATVVSMQESIVGDVRLMLLILFGAVGLVLLIACANVANLLLARAAARSQEVALRSALGARRPRLIRQLLTEGALLSALGGSLAIILAIAAVQFLTRVNPRYVPRIDQVKLDFRVIGFTLLLSVVTTFVFGLAPAMRLSATGFTQSLREVGRGAKGSRRHSRIRNLLVVSELAISLVLLIGSGLLMRSFYRLGSIDPGFNTRGLVKAQVVLPDASYKTPAAVTSFYDQLVQRLDSLPGAQSAAVCTTVPLGANGYTPWSSIVPEGRPFTAEETVEAQYRQISPGFFKTMQIPLLVGRDFNQYDTRTSLPVTIVSQTMARQLWPGENPIGKRILTDIDKAVQVVGVAGDITLYTLDQETDAAFYEPLAQQPSGFLSIVARSVSDDAGIASGIRDVVSAVDRGLPVFGVITLNEARYKTLAPRRFTLLLLSIFAGVALLLSAVGTFGVISYSVAERIQEIGIRMALGARRSDVLSMVVRQAARLALAGVLIGLAAAGAITRVMESLLFKVTPTDPLVFTLVSLFLLTVSLAAAYLPARRATKIDPLAALRYE